MYNFISGAVMLACAVSGLFFYKFWKQTGDRFFNIFAMAFWLLGIERLIPIILQIDDKPRTFIYLIRLLAFILILIAIFLKNREEPDKS
jgi:hypothetical protein